MEVEIKTRKGIHSQKKRLSVYSLCWSKETMKEAGIDVRGAAESATKDQDVTVADILKTGDWSQETTFTRYYYGAGSR